jgi:hypothetical protein
MIFQSTKTGVLTLLLLFSAGGAYGKEVFQARMFTGSGGATSERVLTLRFEVESFTTRDEAFLLAQTFQQSGYDAFIDLFRRSGKGVIRFMGTRGLNIPLKVANDIAIDGGRKIQLFAEAQGWNVDARKTYEGQFLFLVVELEFNAKGKAKGRICEAARVGFSPQGGFQMETYLTTPVLLSAVKKLD